MKIHKGFTLIELMIVAAILGILAAVFIPACTGKHPNQEQEQGQQEQSNKRTK